MLKMKIAIQWNIKDRTLIGGVGKCDAFPNEVKINGKIYKVLGVPYGVSKPYVSLEIEKTNDNLQGLTATSCYTYNVSCNYSKEAFAKTVELIKNNVKNIVDMNYIEDSLDGDQIQTIITNMGKIVVKNIYMVGAVWVESEVELNAIKI